jgi:hypothetical protein
VPVLLWVAIAVILIGVYFAATGRGGELAYEHADHAPLNLGSVSAADVALLRPPTAMWGYNMQVTDAALDAIAQALRDREVTIAHLQQQLTDLTYQAYGTTPAPVGAQDFRPRLGEGPLDVQQRPFPGRHEAHSLTPSEAWLPPAIDPQAADDQPNPVVWEAPAYTEAPYHQASSPLEEASSAPHYQASSPPEEVSPAPQFQASSAPQEVSSAPQYQASSPPEEASPAPQYQASSAPQEVSSAPQYQASSPPEEASPAPQDQAAPDPADQSDPPAVGSGPASAAPGPASAAPGPASAAPGAASAAPGPASAAPGPASASGADPAPGPGADPAPTSGSPGRPGSSDATPGDATPGDPGTGGATLTGEEQGW